MRNTPATNAANTPQKVMKSIQPKEEIAVNITKKVSGSELDNVLQGVGAFTKCFSQEDNYMVEIKVEKVFETDKTEDAE